MMGKILSPEDFVVREIIHKVFFKKFFVKGKYRLYILRKRNLTTHEAVRIIARKMNIQESKIGYAGLKDKFAVTEQYITISNNIKTDNQEIEIPGLNLKFVGMCDKNLSPGDLIGNEFEITLHQCKNSRKIPSVISKIKSGMPNYFGGQRFGIHKNNHIIGRYLVKKEFSKALKMINKYNKKYKTIYDVEKTKLKFFVNAYQSFLWNSALDELRRSGSRSRSSKIYFHNIPIFGYGSVIKNKITDKIVKDIAQKENISQKDFLISELGIGCKGADRKAFIKISELNYEIQKDTVKLNFTLPAGSYATVLLELCENLDKKR